MILSTVEKFRLKTQYRLSTYSTDSNYKQKQGKESAREICLHLFLSSDVRGKFTYRIGTILDLQIGNVKNKQKKRTQESLLQKDNLVFKSEMLLRTFAGFLLSLGQTTASCTKILQLGYEWPTWSKQLSDLFISQPSVHLASTQNPRWFLPHSQEFIYYLQLAITGLFSKTRLRD